MLDLLCARCGKVYHADEDKIGLSILCTTPGCLGVIPVISSLAVHRARPLTVRVPVRKSLTRKRLAWMIVPLLGIIMLVGRHYTRLQQPLTASYAPPPVTKLSPMKTILPKPSQHAKVVALSPASTFTRPPEYALTAMPLRRRPVIAPEIPHYLPPPMLQPVEPIGSSPVPQDSSEALSVSPAPYLSLPTGTDLVTDIGNAGLSDLTVNNGTSQDAVVKLVSSADNRAYRVVYVRANDVWKIGKIAQGMYRLLVLQGTGWESDRERFQDGVSYREFEKPLTFVESRTSSPTSNGDMQIETHWSEETITLHKVTGGNARTHPIAQEVFDAAK